MELFNFQSNGAYGLRIGALILIILGWIGLIIGVVLCLIDFREGFVMLIYGILNWVIMYIASCFCQGIASLVEAAQLYWNINATEDNYSEE